MERGIEKIPRLPSVGEYRSEVERRAKELFLTPEKVEDAVHNYNRNSIQDKATEIKSFRDSFGFLTFGTAQFSNTEHAPAGGVTVAGKRFDGGQFIPGDGESTEHDVPTGPAKESGQVFSWPELAGIEKEKGVKLYLRLSKAIQKEMDKRPLASPVNVQMMEGLNAVGDAMEESMHLTGIPAVNAFLAACRGHFTDWMNPIGGLKRKYKLKTDYRGNTELIPDSPADEEARRIQRIYAERDRKSKQVEEEQ